MENLDNTVIEVLTEEHGKKVIAWWKKQGIDTALKTGNCTKEGNDYDRCYGIIDGYFANYSIGEAIAHNAKIIELPTEEKTFPRMMMCWNDENSLRNVYVLFHDKQLDFPYIGIYENDVERYKRGDEKIGFMYYKHAKEIEEQPKEMTLDEVCNELGYEIKIVK